MPGSCWVKLNANKRTICYGVGGIIWLVFGAMIFFIFESDIETKRKKVLFAKINSTRQLFNMTEEQYDDFRQAIREYEPYEHDTQWSFVGSLYFSITVVTTIGYGHVTPQTDEGKIFCIVYACLGIPLFLVMFQSMGERWNAGARRVFRFIGRKLCFSPRQHRGCNLDGFMIPFGIFTCCLTVAVGSAIFVHYEAWTSLDSIYYCVMTLTTIGFGDFVALQQRQTLNSNTGYVIFCFSYILLGLTLIGAFLNLVVLQKIVSVPQCNNNSHHRCGMHGGGGGRHASDGEDARRRRRGAGSDNNYSGSGAKSFRQKRIGHDKLGAEDESSRKSLDNAINTCENLHLTASNPTYSLTMLHERGDDRDKQRRLSELGHSRMWQTCMSGSKPGLDSHDDDDDNDDDDNQHQADCGGVGSLTSLSVNSDQETAQRLQNFKKTVMKLHERRTGKRGRDRTAIEPRKKFSMLLDICSRPKSGNVGFRTPQNSRSRHYAVTEPCHAVTHSCEIEPQETSLSRCAQGDLVHSRTTSWPLSHTSGEGKVDPRTVSWVRNTLDVLTAGAFADFSNQPGAGGEKEKLCPAATIDDQDLPSITVTSSALLDASNSPGSLGSDDRSVFVTPSPAAERQRSAEMLFLLPPITFGSPASTRRYSGDSGYSGTQSVASTTSHRLITTKSSTSSSTTNNSLLAASNVATAPVCVSRG